MCQVTEQLVDSDVLLISRVLAAEMGRPVMIRMVHCDPVRLSEEQSDEYETVVHPGSGMAVRLYVSKLLFHMNFDINIVYRFRKKLLCRQSPYSMRQ